MVSKQAVKENWFERTDVFEIVHYLSQHEDSGLEAEEIKDLRGKGTEEEVEEIIDALISEEVVNRVDDNYFLNSGVFTRVAQERWTEPLSEEQKAFVQKFCRKYINDRNHGTIRGMITDSMVHGIISKRDSMDDEVIELAHSMSLDKESIDRPGIYAELAMKELLD